MRSTASTPAEEKRGPGRPRGFDRETALRAVLLLFWKHGFDGTSYTDLTEATGMSKPTLYATFGDKIELFRQAMVMYAEESIAIYKEALDQPTAREAVEACLLLARGLQPKGEEPQVCFLVQGALTGSADTAALRAELSAMQREATRMLKQRLDRGKRKGELPVDTNTAALAEYFSSVVTGLSVQAANGAAPKDLNRVIELAMTAWPGKHS
ncbi:TetR/AcrR family transcriptional regulator [Granulicella cerasi]|uniref:TetR/AcrR family transcriptional regulator n=1 Tax=Granulicella cerasi TaxID=741063 RepID=A0ABW1Z6L4_9BACT|nr:TetR/AcrR family transcriptional regulator [Granulicella cerasi]